MPKLSKTQSTLLNAAASRPDLSLLPIPATIRLKGAALERTLRALLERGLLAEDEGNAEVGGGEGVRRQLFVTLAGFAAIGMEAPEPVRVPPGAKPDTPGCSEEEPPARPGGKLGALLDAVSGPRGATLDELATSSGWLPHTTRAALTRLRQRGFGVRLSMADGRKAYRLISAR